MPNQDTVWVEDAVPTGATLGTDGGDAWSWVGASPTPFSGSLAHQSNIVAGNHQHFFYGATETLLVEAGYSLMCYIYLESANPTLEVMLQWRVGASWEHRAYWGGDHIAWGVNNTDSRRPMGALPTADQWVRLEVPASLVGLEGTTLNGMAYTLYSGRATWDYAGKFIFVEEEEEEEEPARHRRHRLWRYRSVANPELS